MEPRVRIESRTVVLPVDDLDTDPVIPARFLTTIGRSGLGAALFHDLRRDPEGRLLPDFPRSRAEAAGARIPVTGANFGCGSSREHAPWALADAGLAAVLSPSLADLLRANAARNGLVPVEVAPEIHARLVRERGVRLTVDLRRRAVRFPDGSEAPFPLAPFARCCPLIELGPLDFLLRREPEIARYERETGRPAP